MHRFFVSPDQIKGNLAIITGEDVNHIKHVLRLKEKDKITILDGQSRQFDGEIISINSNQVELTVSPCHLTGSTEFAEVLDPEPTVKITLAQALPKEKKMDLIIKSCIELGVFQIIPMITERTVIKLDSRKAESKVERWQKIAKEAAQQSGRLIIPKIKQIASFDEVLRLKNYALKLFPWELEERTTLKDVLNAEGKGSSLAEAKILILIGPEGGFSAAEAEKAVKAEFQSVSLGKRILRTETAGAAMLAMINYELEAY